MGAALKNWMESAKLKKWFRRDNLIVMVLSGLLLVLAVLPLGGGTKSQGDAIENSPKDASSPAGEEAWEDVFGGMGGEPDGSAGGEDYAAYLEERLEELLSRMSGVGEVRVMITLASSRELVVEKDSSYETNSTREEDSEGGTRQVDQDRKEEETVFSTQGSTSQPCVVKTLSPQILGVAVVAQGAGEGDVSKNISEAVQALFGIPAHKVKVLKMTG